VRLFRSLITAAAALALTAAVATAHQMPSASVDGLATASTASGKIVPVGHLVAPEDTVQPDEQLADETLAQEDEQSDEADTTDEADSHCIAPEAEATTNTDETSDATDDTSDTAEDTTTETEEPNHGAVVCGAAQAETPDGYANHGAYVSEVARDNHGAEKSGEAKAKHASGDATAASPHSKGHGRR
jgi:hypothetical protein